MAGELPAARRYTTEWLAWQLEAAGDTTVLQAWDFQPGTHFVRAMPRAAAAAVALHAGKEAFAERG
jgi:TIR domain